MHMMVESQRNIWSNWYKIFFTLSQQNRINQQQEIANRERKVLKIEMDDITQVSLLIVISYYYNKNSFLMISSSLGIYKRIRPDTLGILKKLLTRCFPHLVRERQLMMFSIFYRNIELYNQRMQCLQEQTMSLVTFPVVW